MVSYFPNDSFIIPIGFNQILVSHAIVAAKLRINGSVDLLLGLNAFKKKYNVQMSKLGCRLLLNIRIEVSKGSAPHKLVRYFI